jgi:hypothetical protein
MVKPKRTALIDLQKECRIKPVDEKVKESMQLPSLPKWHEE